MNEEETASFERLLSLAEGDTGHGIPAADFLLSWWNAFNCGGFDLLHLPNLDKKTSGDMVLLFTMLTKRPLFYPDEYEDRMRALVAYRRPHLVS